MLLVKLSSCHRRLLSTFNDLGAKMKQLNDIGQYQKVIELYESQVQQQQQKRTTLVVNQALKACIELGDLKHGSDIHKSLSPYFINNIYIRNSLIRLYSK